MSPELRRDLIGGIDDRVERIVAAFGRKWIGNSPQVAGKHYLQLTDEHFRRAIESETKSGAARARRVSRQVASRECRPFTGPCT